MSFCNGFTCAPFCVLRRCLMRNAAFCLLTETEKNSKFRAILNEKTERALTREELRSILLCVSPHRQYSIKVHSDADRFREVLQLSSGFRGKTVLGQVLVSHDNARGELYCPAQPAAIILNNSADESSTNQLHIYIPPSRLRKGNQKV